MKLEELLNKLIERGWYPFCDNNVKEIKIYSDMDMECIYWKKKSDFYYFSPRKITSKESWLWQFVCENKLENPKERKQRSDLDEYNKWYVKYSTKFYEYWLIESALRNESELEQFLLDNIKV